MARRLNRVGIVCGVFLATAACLPVTSKSPIGTTAGYKADPLLTGLWKVTSKNSWGWFAFFPQSNGSTQVVMLEPSAPGDKSGWDKGGWIVFAVHTATLGADRYMDASETEEDGKTPGQKLEHMPVLYRFGADGSLALTLMDEDAAKAAIKAGRIAGQVGPGQFGDLVLTATPAALDAFLESPAGHALFDKPAVILERVGR
jgi:hypothetical protein